MPEGKAIAAGCWKLSFVSTWLMNTTLYYRYTSSSFSLFFDSSVEEGIPDYRIPLGVNECSKRKRSPSSWVWKCLNLDFRFLKVMVYIFLPKFNYAIWYLKFWDFSGIQSVIFGLEKHFYYKRRVIWVNNVYYLLGNKYIKFYI